MIYRNKQYATTHYCLEKGLRTWISTGQWLLLLYRSIHYNINHARIFQSTMSLIASDATRLRLYDSLLISISWHDCYIITSPWSPWASFEMNDEHSSHILEKWYTRYCILAMNSTLAISFACRKIKSFYGLFSILLVNIFRTSCIYVYLI